MGRVTFSERHVAEKRTDKMVEQMDFASLKSQGDDFEFDNMQ